MQTTADLARELLARVDANRLLDLTLDLVRIPSPTGDARAVTEYYANQVSRLGLDVEVLYDYPESPSTIARWMHDPAGPTLTLDGHLDTIHAPHPEPQVADGRIYGRGAGDMKSGIAAMVEATRILMASGIRLQGNLVLATHSLHEAPVGHMEGLKSLIARGDVFTDAALVAESGYDSLNIRGKGQALFEINITRSGEVLHENVARPLGTPNPLDYAASLATRFVERHAELAAHDEPLLGPETFFLGQIHGGDFYNRVPTRAFLNGTHRFWPDKSWTDVEKRIAALVHSIPRAEGLQVDVRLLSNGLGWDVSPRERIVGSLRDAYQTVVGRTLPLTGALSVCDVNVIVREAGIPAVAHGTGTTTAHADLEWVALDNIVRTTRVYLAAIVNYLGVSDAG